MPAHPSDSAVQRSAEYALIASVSSLISVQLTKTVLQIAGATIELDGYNAPARVACEAYAHVGSLKAGQMRKLASDILKLTMVGHHLGDGSRKIIAVAGADAKAWLTGNCWQATAARQFGIEIIEVKLPADHHDQVLAAQVLQFR